MDYIQQVGFLPLLDSGIPGYSAEELVDADCRYVVLPDGGWDWPLWKWKGRIVTEDFVYPLDKHNREYGWGWSLLTLPERLLGREACHCPRTPEESFARLKAHLEALLPEASEKQILKLIG
jgi:hypothetical protein